MKSIREKTPTKVAPAPVKKPYAGHGIKAAPRDEYKTPKDSIWRDVLNHEKILEKNWKETWVHSVDCSAGTPGFYGWELNKQAPVKPQVTTPLPFYRAKIYADVPQKASEQIGWRASDPRNSLEFFNNIHYTPQKLRFVQEQYGYYRSMKLYKNAMVEGESAHDAKKSLPRKCIQHTTKRLLC